MEKPALTDRPLHELIRRRWSPRAFADRSVDTPTLLTLLEAARWSASCFNEQPWSFIIARKEDGAEFGKLLSTLVENNITWAKNAPVLMLTVAKKTFKHNGKPNRHAVHDVGQAMALLTIQALSQGLFVHQMAGILPDKVRDVYGVPEDYEIVAGAAIGYPGDPNSLPPPLAEKELGPRVRKPLEEFLFSGVWGRSIVAGATRTTSGS